MVHTCASTTNEWPELLRRRFGQTPSVPELLADKYASISCVPFFQLFAQMKPVAVLNPVTIGTATIEVVPAALLPCASEIRSLRCEPVVVVVLVHPEDFGNPHCV